MSMKLSNLLSVNHIIPELQSQSREGVIAEMVDYLVAIGDLPYELVADIRQSLKHREEILSTGVGNGVAIPHAFSEHLHEVVAVFGRSRGGIDFASQDGDLVHYVVLFISPRHIYQKHLLMLAAIARMFSRVETHQYLEASTSAEEFFQLFDQRSIPKKA
jgi:mannitol/fructose-specific phosphotransferase system IIA component (Ntr-type)